MLLAEVRTSGINWMEPRDLTLDDARRGVNLENGRGDIESASGRRRLLLGQIG